MHEKNVELSRLRVQVDAKIKINTGISCLVGDVGRLPTSTSAVIEKPDQKLWRKVLYFLVVTIMVVIMCARRVTAQYTPHGRPVHLDSVKALFFYRHRDTTYRRSSPIPQIRCLRGCEYEPEMVRCLNIKGNGRQTRWRCEADLPRHPRFDETAIICEGFDSVHDDHILEGSCGLEYSLLHERKGRLPWLTAILSDWRVSVPLTLLLLGLGYFIYRRYHPSANARGLRRMNWIMGNNSGQFSPNLHHEHCSSRCIHGGKRVDDSSELSKEASKYSVNITSINQLATSNQELLFVLINLTPAD